MTHCLDKWEAELKEDSDRDFLLDGISSGFRITDENEILKPASCRNYKSATGSDIRISVENQIISELEKGNYMFTTSKPTIVSSLGAVPKKNSDKIRLIHDCSRPCGFGVNSYATTSSFKYETVDKATHLLPPHGYLSKIDLSSAYRVVPIHPDCYEATGLSWQFHFNSTPLHFVDTMLPFGASKSPEIFQRLSSAVTRMMCKRGFTVISYLDDFLVIEADQKGCIEAHNILLALLQDLGFVINWDKVVPACQRITFLGIEIDSVNRVLSLPLVKLNELRLELTAWISKKKATKRQLQQLVGKLNWAARMIRGGRTFLRRLIDLICSVKRKHHHIRINTQARADIHWWTSFLQFFNGTASFISDKPVPNAKITSDACTVGGAAINDNDWFYANWAIDYPHVMNASINMKELFTIIIAARRWASQWINQHVLVETDNTAAMYIINSGTCHNTQAMSWLRELFWLSAWHNFHITARHIPGVDNVHSDFLSRLHEPNKISAAKLMWSTSKNHMSQDTFLYLQQLSGNCFSENEPGSKVLPMLSQPREPTRLCKRPTSDSASILVYHPSQPPGKQFCYTPYSWQDHSHPQAFQTISM